ncbi:MAG TPA: hypothetical protein VGI81_07455 [Tepidisphaeraceae bacterium]
MRLSPVVFLVCLASVVAIGVAEERNPQVDAATADAIEGLKAQVLAAHIRADLTVEDLIEKVGGREELDKTLRGAERIGGARWLGDQAVQVRLSIDGSRIAKTLLALTHAHAKESPIPPDALQRQIKWWGDRIFSATGTSTSAGEIARLRPPPSARAWWSVSDADRRKALLAARDNAVDHVIESISPIQVIQGKTLGEALADPEAGKAARGWLEGQPVQSVKFGDDLTVRLTLAVPSDGLWETLRSALGRQHGVPVPAAEGDWNRIRDQVNARAADATGVGLVQPGAARPAGRAAATLPAQPPDWVNQILQAQATAPQSGSPLHTARKGEALAIEKLRDQINQLPLAGGTTVGAAAGRDPAIEQAVAKSLTRARPYQVDYGSKGEVTVHVSLRLANLWSELTSQR